MKKMKKKKKRKNYSNLYKYRTLVMNKEETYN